MIDERHDRLIDTLLLVGVLLAATFEIMTTEARRPAEMAATRANVLGLETTGMQFDAPVDAPDVALQTMGLQHGASAARDMLTRLRDAMADAKATPELQVVWVAMATSYREDRLALGAIATLARNPALLASHEATLDDLTHLASGRPATKLDALTTRFADLGASTWLVSRLRERHFANAGDLVAAAQAAASYRETAADYIGRRVTMFAIPALLALIGLATLFLFPWWHRRLAARGYGGLAGTTSPFRHQRTRRVLFGWVLGSWALGQLLFGVAAALGTDLRGIALTSALDTILNGLLALALIQNWGREHEDARHLGPLLGFTTAPLPKRRWGLAGWLVPGVGVAFAFMFAGVILGSLLLGAPTDHQTSIDLVLADDRFETWLGIGLAAGVAAPVVEEVLFRGFIYRNLRDQLGRGGGAVLSGLIFGAVHMHPTLIIPLTLFGVGLALLYEWSGSLLVPIAAHAAWNIMTLVTLHDQIHV